MSGANTAHGRARLIRHRYTGRSDVHGAIPANYNNCSSAQVVSTNMAGTSCAHYVKGGSMAISGLNLNPGRSLIIESTGTVTITGNITLSDGSYTDISQIPQVMIFADNINIAPNVTRVDAWLLAGLSGDSGTIDTCQSGFSVRSAFTESAVASSTLSGSLPCDTSLRVSGPVIANRVLLHRTAGAGVGMPNSARPAEVFYLSPATYLWAYNQSANLSQAFLTYAREVAPRF
jgi:hypothetical protein